MSETSPGVHGVLDGLRQRGLGEAARVERAKERGQRRVREAVALTEQPTAGRGERGRLGGAGEDRFEEAQEVRLLVVHLDALRGKAPSRRGDDRQLDAPEAPVGVQQAREAARHRHGTEAHMEPLLGSREAHHDLVEVQRAVRRRSTATRRVDEEVEQHLLAGARCGRGGSHRRPGW